MRSLEYSATELDGDTSAKQSSGHFFRVSGFALLIGGVAYVVYILARSVITAAHAGATLAFATDSLWIPINALGTIGAALVLLGLPAVYAGPLRTLGRAGVVLLALGWMIVGLFLSMFGMLVVPWLAHAAPSLVDAINQDPPMVATFAVGLLAELLGMLALALALIRQSRWVAGALLAAVLMTVIGDFVIAPSGPASNLVLNLVSNLGPVLLMCALGALGLRMLSDAGPDAP